MSLHYRCTFRMVAAPTALVQAGTSSTLTNGQATAETDVLIVGAGPAGVMLAAWLAKLGVPYRIVDKRSSKLFTGCVRVSCPSTHAERAAGRQTDCRYAFSMASGATRRR